MHAHECRFILVREIVLHFRGTLSVLRSDQAHFRHQLASVADSQAEGVLTGIETVNGSAGLFIVEEGTGPSFGRTECVCIGESSDEDYHLDVVKCLPS